MKKVVILSVLLGSILVNSISASAESNYTGWRNSDTGWKYYDNGKIITDGVISFNNKLYYFDSLGNLESGWLKDAYFKNGLVQTGWQHIDGKWYYFNKFGGMMKDTTIDGYKIDSNGVYIE